MARYKAEYYSKIGGRGWRPIATTILDGEVTLTGCPPTRTMGGKELITVSRMCKARNLEVRHKRVE